MSALEASVEKFAVEEARRRWGEGSAEKWGLNGWPDRQILPGGGLHFWLELKAEKGKLRKAQEIRAELLEKKGDRVYVPRSRLHIREIYDAEESGFTESVRSLRVPTGQAHPRSRRA